MLLAFRRLPIPFSVALALSGPGAALAAGPTTEECVAANEQSGPLAHAGKLREARTNLVRCSAASCPGVVRDDCIKGALQIDAALPTIVFEARDAAGNDLSDVRVTMDGEPLADKLNGTAIEVDPGEHLFGFDAAGQHLEKRLIVHQGEKNRREPLVLGAAAAVPPPTDSPEDRPHEGAGSGLGPQRIAAIGAGAAGVVGVVVGSVLGLVANSRWDQAKNECGAGCAPGTPAQADASSAHTMAALADVSFAVGAVGLATGAVLWVLAPQSKPATALRLGPFVARSAAGVTAEWSLP
jgi:hypothetical protein